MSHTSRHPRRRFDDRPPRAMMIRAILLTVLALAMIYLSGCTAVGTALSELEEHSLGIRMATAEYIGADAGTAERVIQFARSAEAQLGGDVAIRLDRLAAEVDAFIPWHRMSPAQRILAEDLFVSIEQRLGVLAINGELPPEGVASLRSILETIERTALREKLIAEAHAQAWVL